VRTRLAIPVRLAILMALVGGLALMATGPVAADHACPRDPWPSFRTVAPTAEPGDHRPAPDRSVWVTASVDPAAQDADLKCDGVVRFDGAAFSHFLKGTCVYAMDAAADGTLWIQAGRVDIYRSPPGSSGAFHLAQSVEPIGTYVIRPPH
jgi:hypothetical protein